MQQLAVDTLTHPVTKVVGGALPIAADMPSMHSVGQTITSYGGALLASTLIHLFITGITYLKNRKSNVNKNNSNQTNSVDTTKVN